MIFDLSSSSNLKLPPQLPSIEESLQTLSAAIIELKKPGLSRAEVSRLRGIISAIKTYKELFADYVNYRVLENEVVKLRQKLADQKKKAT